MTAGLQDAGHEVWWLTRGEVAFPRSLRWDGQSQGPWSHQLAEMDAVVNVTGYSLSHWPWTAARKRRFVDSRVQPARALSSAILKARPRPGIYLQTSGINFYGLTGSTIADESSKPSDDFLAQLSVEWEGPSDEVEAAGVRRVITRNAIVLARSAGMLPIMALPIRLFMGGRLGDGRQALPWIHISDYVGSVMFLLQHAEARGVYNLVSPTQTSSDEFMRALAKATHRPYWFPTPVFLLRLLLGEMSVLVTAGRYTRPQRLEALGYRFQFPRVEEAMTELFPSG